jgi:hypothetical protein
VNKETAYLFRHALLRDAAYQLHLPGDRARLHGLALALIEAMCGGPPLKPPSLGTDASPPFAMHATDAFALGLAGHALSIRREVGNRRGEGHTLPLQAGLCRKTGLVPQARTAKESECVAGECGPEDDAGGLRQSSDEETVEAAEALEVGVDGLGG